MTKSLLALGMMAFSISAHAAPITQFIDCHFSNPADQDHVIVSFKGTTPADIVGTFFYSSGLDSEGDDTRTGKLVLTRMPSTAGAADQAVFQSVTEIPGELTKIQFTFSLPTNLILKAAPSFKGHLSTEIISMKSAQMQDLVCMSKLY